MIYKLKTNFSFKILLTVGLLLIFSGCDSPSSKTSVQNDPRQKCMYFATQEALDKYNKNSPLAYLYLKDNTETCEYQQTVDGKITKVTLTGSTKIGYIPKKIELKVGQGSSNNNVSDFIKMSFKNLSNTEENEIRNQLNILNENNTNSTTIYSFQPISIFELKYVNSDKSPLLPVNYRTEDYNQNNNESVFNLEYANVNSMLYDGNKKLLPLTLFWYISSADTNPYSHLIYQENTETSSNISSSEFESFIAKKYTLTSQNLGFNVAYLDTFSLIQVLQKSKQIDILRLNTIIPELYTYAIQFWQQNQLNYSSTDLMLATLEYINTISPTNQETKQVWSFYNLIANYFLTNYEALNEAMTLTTNKDWTEERIQLLIDTRLSLAKISASWDDCKKIVTQSKYNKEATQFIVQIILNYANNKIYSVKNIEALYQLALDKSSKGLNLQNMDNYFKSLAELARRNFDMKEISNFVDTGILVYNFNYEQLIPYFEAATYLKDTLKYSSYDSVQNILIHFDLKNYIELKEIENFKTIFLYLKNNLLFSTDYAVSKAAYYIFDVHLTRLQIANITQFMNWCIEQKIADLYAAVNNIETLVIRSRIDGETLERYRLYAVWLKENTTQKINDTLIISENSIIVQNRTATEISNYENIFLLYKDIYSFDAESILKHLDHLLDAGALKNERAALYKSNIKWLKDNFNFQAKDIFAKIENYFSMSDYSDAKFNLLQTAYAKDKGVNPNSDSDDSKRKALSLAEKETFTN